MDYLKLNLERLKEVLQVQSSVYDEGLMRNYIVDYLKFRKITFKRDKTGNIYITKGIGLNGYPCIVSHMDTVHDINLNSRVYQKNGFLFAFDKPAKRQVGIGGDDKVGIYLCLEFLELLDDVKIVFFTQEETGCIGSKNCNKDFFDDVQFIIQPDRRGSDDLIKYGNGVQLFSNEFENEILPYLNKWNYKINKGGSTDVVQLKEDGLNISCFNLSCGYYDPHTNKEVVYIDDVEKCLNFMYDVISNISYRKWTHILKKEIKYLYDLSIKELDNYYGE